VGRPFDRWAELENTYHFVATCKPELFAASYGEAKTAAQEAAASEDVKPLAANGAIGNGRRSDVITPTRSRGSTGVEYLVRRLKRDAPEMRALKRLGGILWWLDPRAASAE
jgi:hypothetical protein